MNSLGNTTEELKCYEAAIKLKPDYAEAYIAQEAAHVILNNLDKHYAEIKHYDEALKFETDYEKVYKIYKDKIDALLRLGNYEISIKHLNAALKSCDEVLKSCDELIKLKPSYADKVLSEFKEVYGSAYIMKASVFEYIGRPDESLKCFDEIIKIGALQDADFIVRGGRAAALMALGRGDEIPKLQLAADMVKFVAKGAVHGVVNKAKDTCVIYSQHDVVYDNIAVNFFAHTKDSVLVKYIIEQHGQEGMNACINAFEQQSKILGDIDYYDA